MDVTMRRSDLVRELGLMNKVVNRKPTLPVLGGVLMTAADGGIAIAATDLEVAVTSQCLAIVGERGKLVLPAQRLYDLARSFVGDEIKIASLGASVLVTADGFRAQLSTHAVEDFPQLPTVAADAAPATQLPRATLAEMIRRTRYAVSEDDKRFYLGGVQVEVNADAFRLVSTDAKRLALVDAPLVASQAPAVLLPRKAIDALSALLDDDDGETIALTRAAQHTFMRVGDRLLASRMIDGKFPAYQAIVPKIADSKVVVERAAFALALRRASMVAHADTRAVKIAVSTDVVRVAASSAEAGESDEKVAASYAGSEYEVTLHAGYVLDFLDAAAAERVTFERADARSPVVFRAKDGDLAYLSVVLPLVF